MPQLYLTPAAVAYLTQFILALAITLFLLNRLRSSRAISLILITVFFASMAALTGLLVLDAALSPFYRVIAAYAENAVLALGLAALNGFAYQFPERYPQRKWERRIILTLSLLFLFWEVGFMVYRYISVLTEGNVYNRFPLAAYSLPIVVLFAPIAFIRQTLAADPRRVFWWRKLWQPAGKGARGARNFALVFGVPVLLGLISVLLNFGLPFMVYSAAMSIGLLVMFFLFAANYVNFIPGGVNVASRLSILALTLFLALVGMVGWLIAPPYAATFQPDLRDHQTLRFTPNAAGGYDVSEVDFHFETALGEKILAPTLGEKANARMMGENGNHRVEFIFPFYGKTYAELYVTYSGAISLGEPFRPLNLQAEVARVPTLFPLLIDLAPDPAKEDSGLYVRKDSGHLVVTWNRLPDSFDPEASYTFQAILYADGIFEFTYNDLPQPILFKPDSSSDAPSLRGVVAGRGEPLHEQPDTKAFDLITLSRAGVSPLLENFNLAFRDYLRTFMLPVAWLVVGGSLLILLVIPLLVRSSIAHPLEALTFGVRRMEAGEGRIAVPVQSEDEIGFLTGSFNKMSNTIEDLVHNLETRVAERTRELNDVNASLRAEESQRKAALEKMRESEEKFQKAFHASPDSVTITRLADGRIVEVNDGFSRITGYTRDEALSSTSVALQLWANPQDREAFIRTLQNEHIIRDAEYDFCAKSGIILNGLLSAEIIQLGDEPHIVSVIHDITERKQAEEKLKRAQEELAKSQGLYQDLVERQVVGVYRLRVKKHFSWDSTQQANYEYEFVNDEYCRLTGTSREAHFADPTLTLKMIHPEDYPSFARKNEEVDISHEPFVWEGRMIVRGEIRWVHYESSSRKFPDQGLIWTGVLMDITERKQAEQKLQQAQAHIVEQQRAVAAFEERERLARELHDGIGQTLGYVNLQADAARELLRQNNPEGASQMLARLSEAAQEAHGDVRGYIHNLKSDLPAIREGFFSALEKYCQHLRQAYLFEVTLHFPAPLPDPLASAEVETHLTYIIREALSNARRYSGENQATVIIEMNEEMVQAVIADEGVGMEAHYTGPERRARERFGIRIMRERAAEMGGALTIESQAGKGARVIVHMPRKLSAEPLSHLRILIVDDHPLFVEGLRNMLATRGAQVVGWAKDGLEAQDMARGLNPDLILMDINMPRMDGLEATRLIKAEMPEMKIVMLTTSAGEADLFEALRAGAAGYILKGMSAGEFISTLGGVARGEVEFSAEMAQQILLDFPSASETRAPESDKTADLLTERQTEILRLVANGLVYKEIAERLFLAESTVKYHMGEILTHLHLKGRREAMAFAKHKGIK